MPNPSNYLRIYRRKSPLGQGDIASLLELTDKSNISRYENGQRAPAIEVMLIYYLLFNTSIEAFFEPLTDVVQAKLQTRIPEHINLLTRNKDDPKTRLRIQYLKEVLTRLTNPSKDNESK